MSKKNEFRIDPDRIPEECLNHSDVFHDYALELADARMRLDEAEDALKIIYAEQEMDVRRHPSKHGLADLDKKPTDPLIKAAVLLTKAYQSAAEDVIRAKHEVRVVEAAVDSLEHKKRMLEKLSDLGMADFFSMPKMGRLQERLKEDVLGGPKKLATTKSRS